ncbi:hypothetical protein METBIDRAFT_79361 [Metschnikowia bicuspidata var. bicuspidata NRRL YB-4993]|uniref:Proteasome assembly chaperone 2 n=1 Tax=Metschnikowia bicuspidata var. bicuspidata NRRL YB-4993 TaxID=869754 RepID=A0A1A0H7Q5_9ASCO|nr:hypothetical protein METBIDRAFT_79361 [Metschnikowia bicuspidata var. bicuspidata NRRL YB-4993]OBA20056.1 hypothetical protein METBIDRAFT_79361 [Metschnikowia bicuspidata var. bicuspidata NRRL YB-4993]
MTLRNSILLIPSVSIANIPQLALDLLLHSLEFKKVATLSDDYLYPFVSPVDHASTSQPPGGVSFGLEVFFCKGQNLTLIQQRAPLMPGFPARHVAEVIVPFVEASQFKHVVVLHLLDAGLARGVLPGDVLIFTSEDVLTESFSSLSISKTATDPTAVIAQDTSPYAKALVDIISKYSTLSLIVIYAYEGDNLYDAQVMGRKSADFLLLRVEEWRSPVSWYGVYGDKPVPLAMEEGMYG